MDTSFSELMSELRGHKKFLQKEHIFVFEGIKRNNCFEYLVMASSGQYETYTRNLVVREHNCTPNIEAKVVHFSDNTNGVIERYLRLGKLGGDTLYGRSIFEKCSDFFKIFDSNYQRARQIIRNYKIVLMQEEIGHSNFDDDSYTYSLIERREEYKHHILTVDSTPRSFYLEFKNNSYTVDDHLKMINEFKDYLKQKVSSEICLLEKQIKQLDAATSRAIYKATENKKEQERRFTQVEEIKKKKGMLI